MNTPSGNEMIRKFVRDQLSLWPLAAGNFRDLKHCESRDALIGGLKVKLQHNPARVISSAAKLDAASIKARRCFLCEANRPPQQKFLNFSGRKGREYHILLNPYPIFPSHLVIARKDHTPQSIWHHFVDMLDLTHHYTDYTFFYNGPHSGASAPDHFHFQACPRALMPLEKDIDRLLGSLVSLPSDGGVPNGEETAQIPASLSGDLEYISSIQEAQLFHYKHFARGVFALRSRTSKSMAKLFYRLLDCAPVPKGQTEPLFNLIAWYAPTGASARRPKGYTHGLAEFEYRAIVVLRSCHRSHHYFSEGEDHLTMSPGCADMGGMFIVPSAEDYAKISEGLLSEMLSEVTVSEETQKEVIWRMTRTQPRVSVGLLSAEEISFEMLSDGAGTQTVRYRDGRIEYNGALYDELYFEAATMSTLFAEPTFVLKDMVIGKEFHWQRQLTRKFAGALKFIVEGERVTAVNVIGIEDYLLSVISSEMKASSPLELLKAHAVISRSWLLSRPSMREIATSPSAPPGDERIAPPCNDEFPMSDSHPFRHSERSEKSESRPPIIIRRWFDHEEHTLYDVCADDHCQRYQGLTEEIGESAREAIDKTWGQVLTYDGTICDTRFSKCCGGHTEKFSTAWQDEDFPYLPSLPDTPSQSPDARPFCQEATPEFLSTILNGYDLETKDFYQWEEAYSVDELSELISRKSGYDIGRPKALVPEERGEGGRIVRLRIEGTRQSLVVGKELMIRRLLSETHLKSSAFEIHWQDGDSRIVLHGKGWGHGVGLCQIGAAVMASKGYSYREILEHYYPKAALEVKTQSYE